MKLTYTSIEDAVSEYRTIYVDAEAFPALTENECLSIIKNCLVKDANGQPPTSSTYQVTVRMELAAYRGWALKKARSVAATDFSADGQSFSRSQISAHCQEQLALYRDQMVSGW